MGALDGLSPGVSTASSSESLKGLLRGRRGGGPRETDSERSSRISRESSSDNLRDAQDLRLEPSGPLSATPSTLWLLSIDFVYVYVCVCVCVYVCVRVSVCV